MEITSRAKATKSVLMVRFVAKLTANKNVFVSFYVKISKFSNLRTILLKAPIIIE